MPPSVPLNHYFGSENQQNRTEVLFHYSMQEFSGTKACFEHSNLFKVNVLSASDTRLKASRSMPTDQQASPPVTLTPVNRHSRKEAQPLNRLAGLIRWLPDHTNERRHVAMQPRSNYELFNCNNFNIRFWSWSYRGCWHQTCPPVDPR